MTRLFPPVLCLSLIGCIGSNLQNQPRSVASEAGTVIEGEFIVNLDLDVQAQDDLGLAKLDFDPVLGAGLYRTDDHGLTLSAIEALLKDRVRDEITVENNRVVRANSTDPYRSLQWNLDLLDIESAWAQSTGAGVVVAVIDTGVSWAGEDTPTSLVAGWDYVDGDGDPTDENGHGTHVAGTVAQATGNGAGVAGVAPDATVLAIRVLDAGGSGSVYWSAKAVRYAADNGADVVNLSLGSPWASGIEQDAIEYAAAKGVVLVAASGNSGQSRVDYPAAYPEVIAVGAVGGDGRVAGYSNGGQALDLVAPGGDLSRDVTGDGYADGILQETLSYRGTTYEFFEGTSMATPHVAGVAALLISAGASPSEVHSLMAQTATDIGSPGWDSASGQGLVNPAAALALLGAPPSGGGGTPPTESDTTGPEISGVWATRTSGSMTIGWTTDEPATTEIEFEEYGWFGDQDTYVTNHEQAFTVDDSTTYYFTLISTDAAGNETRDGVWYVSP